MDYSEKRSGLTEKGVTRYWDGNADLWTDHVRRGWDTYREYLNNPAFMRFILYFPYQTKTKAY